MRVVKSGVCVLVCLLATACTTPEAAKPTLAYSVGGCTEQSETARATTAGEVQIVGQGDKVHVSQKLNYVCCAELVLTVAQEGSTIRLLEKNVGEICRCVCDYEVEADIAGLTTGVYQVEVWGVEYQDVHTPELLGQATITL